MTNLLSLPYDMLQVIFLELNARDALSFSNSCATLFATANRPGFWATYMARTRDTSKTDYHATPWMFPFESLPKMLDWTDRELVILQSTRICAEPGYDGCMNDAEGGIRGQWICHDGVRRTLCIDCHDKEHHKTTPSADQGGLSSLNWTEQCRSALETSLRLEGLHLRENDLWCSDFLRNPKTTLGTRLCLTRLQAFARLARVLLYVLSCISTTGQKSTSWRSIALCP